MNIKAIENYSKVKWWMALVPLSVIVGIVAFLACKGALSSHGYVMIQKDLFLWINSKLGIYQELQNNMTQMGNAVVILSFFGILVIYAPRVWDAVMATSVITLLVARIGKETLKVPRPLTAFRDGFTVIGEEAVGRSSCPSGHSMTVFAFLTLFIFLILPMCREGVRRTALHIFLILLGLFIAFSRVAVGAHHPLDVIIGSCLGYSAAVAGIVFTNKYKLFRFVESKKARWFFVLLFVVGSAFLIKFILEENLAIYYVALFNLIISIYIILRENVREKRV